ncbi:hypothetical protein [Paenibacillus sp. HB172176]|nr:hypothetical protein [Paenibacillus sp. HB172176]
MDELKEISEHVHARFGMTVRGVKAIDKGWLKVAGRRLMISLCRT